MGQQNSRKANDCGCGCNYERRRYECASSSTSSVQRYVSAVTERLAHRACACRARRPACVCTNYRRDRLPEVLTHLRRELDAIVLNSADETRESDNVQEVYVLSVGRNVDQETQSSGANEAAGGGERRPHIQVRQVVCGSELRALLLQRNPSPPLTPTAPHRVHTQVTVLTGEELGALLRRSVPPPPPHGRGSPLTSRVHTQVDYIHCLVPDLQEITACSFYWGKMDRYEAERLLDNKPEGTFLLRDSAQEEHLFSVSFRKYGRSLHARIEHYEHKFSFDSHDPAVFCAATVTGLIEHYKDPSCVMFFEPMLTAPLPRASAFSLQQLSRAAIVSHTSYDGVDKLPLPPRLRCYLKEYHYRQRVRVRSLDQSQPRTYEPFN